MLSNSTNQPKSTVEPGYIHSGSGSQSQGRDKFDASFSRGSSSSQGGTNSKFK